MVYGYGDDVDEVLIADRSRVPLTVTKDELASARGRIKKDKFQILQLDIPNPDRLAAAVSSGIWDCIKLFTEKPPRGSAKNFGLAAYRNWIDLLRNPKQRLSWTKEFPVGPKMYAGLVSAFSHYGSVGIRDDAERSQYTEFLNEAAVILDRPDLKAAAARFQKSAKAWRAVAAALLPDEVAPFGEARELISRRARLFVRRGGGARPELVQIDERLGEIRSAMEEGFPLNESEAQEHREQIADRLQAVHDLECGAIDQLRSIMSERA